MFSRALSLAFFLLVPSSIFAQSIDSLWTRMWITEGRDEGIYATRNLDGNYIFTGYTNVAGDDNYDFFLALYTPEGDQLWTNTYGTEYHEFNENVVVCSEGGYAVATMCVTGQLNFYRIDDNGDMLWTEEYQINGPPWRVWAVENPDRSFTMAGFREISGTNECLNFLQRIDPDGNPISLTEFNGDFDSRCYSVKNTSDGGWIACGRERVHPYADNNLDASLYKFNADAELEWMQTIGGHDFDEMYDVEQTFDGGYILAGVSETYGAQLQNGWIVKADNSGEVEWSEPFGGNNDELFNSVRQTTDGEYIVCGTKEGYGATSKEAWVIRVDALGNMGYEWAFGGRSYQEARSIEPVGDDDYIMAGLNNREGIGYEAWLVKLHEDYVSSVPETGPVPTTHLLLNAYPDPFNCSINLSFHDGPTGISQVYVYNTLGKLVMTKLISRDQVLPLKFDGFPSGSYYLQVSGNNGIHSSKRITLLK